MSHNFDPSTLSDVVAKDIIELQQRIENLKKGKEDEERFKHYRLTRGVYGQRQFGVQMFRTKLPYGKITTEQLIRLADVSEQYTRGNLHLTTRQNIQLHYVKLTDTPAIWTQLSEVGITARGACGNTVRNITASPNAGIDPDELFDVTPYVQATFEYFLRNPICQDMGRKIKIAFSSSDRDSAYTYFHDFGFIPRIKIVDGEEQRGFKVVIAGGLGAQAIVAPTAYEFLAEDQIIPFMEAAIRVFDRYGEREKRFKARMKFLVKKLGVDGFLDLVNEERIAIKNKSVVIDRNLVKNTQFGATITDDLPKNINLQKLETWVTTNVYEQKQKGYFAAQIRIPLGDIHATKARQLAQIIRKYATDDIRLTVNQGMLLKYITESAIPFLFHELDQLGFADPGFDSLADVTACPGTDTCVLGVTNSTGLALKLEEVVQEEYPHLLNESNIKIKISGCMNACGQHMAANIGFHGSSIKKKPLVIPAMQIVLGGGVDVEGRGFIAQKVIKLPTKQIPNALRALLNDYEDHSNEGEYFNDYYQRQGKIYFYNLLKPLANTDLLGETDIFDWGQDQAYRQEIGVGECAGVALDMVGTILNDAKEKIQLATEAIEHQAFNDGIYHAYSAMVIGAKGLLLAKDVKCNTHKGIINDFQTHYVDEKEIILEKTFPDLVLQINQNEANELFANSYLKEATKFFKQVISIREEQLQTSKDKTVISNYYKA